MKDDFSTLQLEPLLVSFAVASRQVEILIRTHGHGAAKVICRGVLADKALPKNYRLSIQTAFGG